MSTLAGVTTRDELIQHIAGCYLRDDKDQEVASLADRLLDEVAKSADLSPQQVATIVNEHGFPVDDFTKAGDMFAAAQRIHNQ